MNEDNYIPPDLFDIGKGKNKSVLDIFKLKKSSDGYSYEIKVDFNQLTFNEIIDIMYNDLNTYVLVKIDHPDYSKITEFYEFLKK